MKWVLIIVHIYNSHLTAIPGFKSEGACVYAGKEIKAHWHNRANEEIFEFQCVPMNGPSK